MHTTEDQVERPIAYASHSLHPAKRKYSQLDKEALAILFGVTKFHQYLYGRHFIIYSDHKPLMYICGESKSIPSVASARVQRWALTLSAYTYSIKYRKGEDMCNADALSCLPRTAHPEIVPRPPETIALLEHLANVPLAASQIKSMTDVILLWLKLNSSHKLVGQPPYLINSYNLTGTREMKLVLRMAFCYGTAE